MPVHADLVTDSFADIVSRFTLASKDFEHRLAAVRADQWTWPTPCSEWNVRQLVCHMTRGNLMYIDLVGGGTSEQFLRLRDVDALGGDPLESYRHSVRDCAAAFSQPTALDRILNYPLGSVPGRQSLAVRTMDTVIHTWDLARAIGADEQLDLGLVNWIDDHLAEIFAGLADSHIDGNDPPIFCRATPRIATGSLSAGGSFAPHGQIAQ